MSEKNENTLTIAFYKGDVVSDFVRKSDNTTIAVIAFPNSSKYAGYVWYYPLDWIKSNDDQNANDSAYSFNPDKRWIRMNKDHDVTIVKSQKDEDTGKWSKVDEITVKATDLKEYMKRPYKEKEDEEE